MPSITRSRQGSRQDGRAALPDLAWRCAGMVALGGAALSSLAHRAVLEAHRAGPPSVWEAFFGLVSFVFASLGVLLLLHGRRLFRREAATLARQDDRRSMTGSDASSMPFDGRQLTATVLAAQALRHGRRPDDRAA